MATRGAGRMSGLAGRLLLFIGAALQLLLITLVVGAYLPTIPYLGLFGMVAVSMLTPYLVLLLAIAGVVSGRRWRRGGGIGSAILTCATVLALIGAAFVYVAMWRSARAAQVSVDFGRTLIAPVSFGNGAPPETARYDSYQGEPLDLDIYRPIGRTSPKGAPVLIFIHGGGWISGTKRAAQYDLRWFADHGWLVLSIEYTLSSQTRHLWADTTPQIGCAMAWVAKQASRYGGDVSRLALAGDSAGGNLAINASYQANKGTLRSSCGGNIPRVLAVSAAYPVVDPANVYDNPDLLCGPSARNMALSYTGGTPRSVPERYAAIRSATHLSRMAPATLLVVSKVDHLVPPEPVHSLAAAARSAGVPAELIQLPYGDHSFASLPGAIGNQVYDKATLRFIERYAARR